MANEFIGGRICLDLANTVDWRTRADPVELLLDYPSLVAWSVRAGTVSPAVGRRLTDEAAKHPRAAAASFERALALREAFYRTALAHARGETPPGSDLGDVVRAYAEAVRSMRLTLDGSSYEWSLDENTGDLDRSWRPVAVSAVELLMSPELSQVRECEGRGCGWLFLDESRSRTRRWCSAAGCGNRERVRRHYERTKRRG